ncbi:glutamate racemase [Altererythrobacter sp. HHU K3-1]|uniref:Glutamate racemase n=2 Tax=Qipengyuania atrilutea TaxID=2744473 RepID=A0A850H0I3_9SPHN|nr:glutamate racemase [Actirhodobacter atriluteus]
MLDSGVGGLSVLTALRHVLPQAPVIYAADLAGLPYGDKSEREIAARVAGLLGRMSERYQPRLACIACNTASTIALGMVRDVLEIPVVGTVPAIKPAASLTRSGVIGLLGTTATIRQPYVDNLEAEFAAGKTLIRHAAPELVGEAEAMLRGEAADADVVRRVVEGLRAHEHGEKIDTLVLACTHFPLLTEALTRELGEDVTLVDGAEGIARRIAWLTREQDFADAPMRFVATGSEERLALYRPALARYGFASTELF